MYLSIQPLLPRAKGKAFTFCQPFLALPQGEQDRFYFFLTFFFLPHPDHGQCRVCKPGPIAEAPAAPQGSPPPGAGAGG